MSRLFTEGQRVRVKGMASLVGRVAKVCDDFSRGCSQVAYEVRLDLQGDVDPGRYVPYWDDELEPEPEEK